MKLWATYGNGLYKIYENGVFYEVYKNKGIFGSEMVYRSIYNFQAFAYCQDKLNQMAYNKMYSDIY